MDAITSWNIKRAYQWYMTKGIILGVNFLPSTSVNSIDMWQAESFDLVTIEKELDLMEQTGFNSIRVFLPYIVWEEDAMAL